MPTGSAANPGGAAYQYFQKDDENKNLVKKGPVEFEDSLWACCNRPGLAVKVFFCPCCVAAENSAETLHHDYNCELFMYCCCYPCIAPVRRAAFRRKFGLPASKYDCQVHLFCPCCALCQERRHVLQNPLIKNPAQEDME
mmetsp:Transcript_12391/g.14663  ORF Transcript_12391/g.14663 Transcript_12391/m.14663 type:complete len:140 (+) Transcript_12391:48-467(+)|eukprot:jgi/Bigna1/58845/fgenesh1_kg.1_\